MTTSEDKYWFKNKRLGWGWTPKNWKGWSALAVFVLAVTFTGLLIKPFGYTAYFFCVFIESCLLIFLCYKKGPPPGGSDKSKQVG